ncbi:MBL fold metallo-hydrolase [Demequina sp. SYSU T00192]|uniref:MBL fold metallo-hydrolase n=1 Tax=Demequina litoralis TaxID=3051660 RepID=A0ABT8GBQ2_9MICO|nr:MBL fold metallo-hydrolase [Demequina sp. SYSU T00192]MDN4476564.1 MBL fold metallo-hydrolase [Demequina sp. SYSU T00192]
MRLTKHSHACVAVESGDGRLLVDPGVYTPDAAALLAGADAVLLTHEHPDHVHAEVVLAALADRPELVVYGPEAVVGGWVTRFPGRAAAVAPGDAFAVGGIDVEVHGGTHAVVHADLPVIANVGYLIGGRVYHPGDSYAPPGVDVEVLLVPVSGPWVKLGEAADYVRAVAPARAIQIHDAMLSEIGAASVTRFLGTGVLSPIDVERVAVGEAIDL